jgi:hypothetical protein
MAEKKSSAFGARKTAFVLLALIFIAGGTVAAWNIVTHAQASTLAIEQILKTYNLRNEGEKSLDSYSKEHPFLSMFLSSPVKQVLKLPSQNESAQALHEDVAHQLKIVREESSSAAWWSWFLLSLSLVYLIIVVAVERRHDTRPVLFALTSISMACFVIGIFTPAMVIWTAPNIPLASGDLNFVVQHQVRGIAAIIEDLFAGSHEIIGALLLFFGVVMPVLKATLTYSLTLSTSKTLSFRMGQLLHTVSKWSMADVLVGALLLALYALKFQQATKSIPCLGIYYFIVYCLISMIVTELLSRSGVTEGGERRQSRTKFGFSVIGGLAVAVFCLLAASSLYTYRQYTENGTEKAAPSAPGELNNADLVLPGHKK